MPTLQKFNKEAMITPYMNKVEIQKQMWTVNNESALVVACVHKFGKECRKLLKGRVVMTRRFFHKETNQAYIICMAQSNGVAGSLMVAEVDHGKQKKPETGCVQILGNGPGELMSTKLEPPATTTLSDIKVKEGMILNGIMLYMHDPGCPERDIFFYHSDHLGGASWITDASGTPIQHIRYLPYGETYVNERTTGYNERFTFTGKETDCETGFSYFGARYYDPTLLTSWTAVDPMADKYPSLSPYNYCAWNPMKLVDPDGKEFFENDDIIIKGSNNSSVTIKTDLVDCLVLK